MTYDRVRLAFDSRLAQLAFNARSIRVRFVFGLVGSVRVRVRHVCRQIRLRFAFDAQLKEPQQERG